MTRHHYISPESNQFVRPLLVGVIAALALLLVSLSVLWLASALQFDLVRIVQVLSVLTSMNLLVIALLFWKLYFALLQKHKGRRDAKITWLAIGVTSTCITASAMIALSLPSMSTEQTEGISVATAALLLSVIPTIHIAVKSIPSIAALFDSLRATERARITNY